jgi:hypothetical protein
MYDAPNHVAIMTQLNCDQTKNRETTVTITTSLKHASVLLLALLTIALGAVFVLSATVARADDRSDEIKEGKAAADSVVKQEKLITSGTDFLRVQRVGAKIAQIANTVQVPAGFGNDKVYQFNYTYRVIDSKEMNAFSLPGGNIFIYKGLLDLMKTDDMLAAVLGHETAHAAHHHVRTLEHQANKEMSQLALGTLALILAKAPAQDVGNITAGGQAFMQADLSNHYSERAEEDADHTGMIFMQKAGFNPVGMISLLDVFKDEEDRSPLVEMGYLQDHPLTPDRIAAAKAELAQLGVKYTAKDLRETEGATDVEVVIVPTTASRPGTADLRIGDTTLCSLAQSRQTAAQELNELLDNDLRGYEVKADGPSVVARGRTVLTFTGDDVGAQRQGAPSDPSALAAAAVKSIKTALWSYEVTGDA